MRDEPVTSLNLSWRGVFAALGGQRRCDSGVDGQDQALPTGYEIVPGVVAGLGVPDHVFFVNR